MTKLEKLLSLCKCGVHIIVNDHRNVYKTIEVYFANLMSNECPPKVTNEVYQGMVERDTLIELQFYPDTPIGSYTIYHYDLDAALTEALACFDEDRT